MDEGDRTLRLDGPGVTLETRRDGLAFLIFDRPQEKVNVLGGPVVAVLEILLDQAARDKDVRAMIVTSAKPGSFIAGADVSEIAALRTIQDAESASRRGQRLFDTMDRLPFPVVAAINGTCLGGGTELALACHFRVAADDARVEIGLPEVSLGIIPGWGGTQRLPRLLGIGPALDLILGARSVNARKALKLGLVDAVAPPETLLEAAERLALAAAAGHRRPRRALSDSPAARYNPVRWMVTAAAGRMARRTLRARVHEAEYPAPYRAIEAVVHGLRYGMEAGLRREAHLLGQLAASRTCKSLVSLFFLRQEARRDPGVQDPSVRPRDLRAAAVLGAGVMGGGIAQSLTRAGLPVRLKDIDLAPLARGMRAAWDLNRAELKKKRIDRREFDRRMALLRPTLDPTGFRRADIVIEAVVESLEVKRRVLRDIEEVIGEACIFATNTSSLPIDSIASRARHPENVVGLHFFNPVHKMPLVEVVRGPQTSDQTVATAVALAKRIGKTPVVVGDAPGFLVNRILMAYLGEALLLVEEGARIDDIDRTMLAFGMPMGPCALLDQIGLDVALHVAGVLTEAFRDRAPRSGLLASMKEKGWLGRKSGRGFYVYAGPPGDGGGDDDGGRRPGAPREANTGVYGLLASAARQPIDPAAAENRLVFPMINEAARCLESGIVRAPGQVDLAMVFGTGFPAFRGGLLRHADSLGTATIVQGLEAMAGRYGPRFLAARYLLELARDGRGFYERG